MCFILVCFFFSFFNNNNNNKNNSINNNMDISSTPFTQLDPTQRPLKMSAASVTLEDEDEVDGSKAASFPNPS